MKAERFQGCPRRLRYYPRAQKRLWLPPSILAAAIVILLSFFRSTRAVVRVSLAVATAHGLEDFWAESWDLDALPLVVSYFARSRFHFAEQPGVALDASDTSAGLANTNRRRPGEREQHETKRKAR